MDNRDKDTYHNMKDKDNSVDCGCEPTMNKLKLSFAHTQEIWAL